MVNFTSRPRFHRGTRPRYHWNWRPADACRLSEVLCISLSLCLVFQKRHYVNCLNCTARDGGVVTLEGLVRAVHVQSLFWSSTAFLKITQSDTPPTDQEPYGIDFQLIISCKRDVSESLW